MRTVPSVESRYPRKSRRVFGLADGAVLLAISVALAGCTSATTVLPSAAGRSAPSRGTTLSPLGGSSSKASPAASHGADQEGGVPAPNGALTLLDGSRAQLSSFETRPLLLWFIAAGCASCAVSIPAVAEHLAALRAEGVRVLVVGISGDFGNHPVTNLREFGQAAAGAAFSEPGWTWGMASQALTLAYDPSGIPDDYFLISASGRIVYHNSVPVSTMPALLEHASALSARVS